ncbi:MAG: energy-coupling factor transporter ATPase [Escherichia coli]|nr:MAG: energy-coupling factor transporter ATPase [Escherichia coli]
MEIIKCENLKYLYGAGTPFATNALCDVSFSIEKGEIVGIIGHTGSGKSTLIEHLNGLLKADSGTVYLEGKDIWEDKSNIKNVRFSVGLCFQYPEYQIFEEDVFREIAFGPKKMGFDDEEIKKRVLSSAKFLGIDKDILDKSPFDLSGGQKRRVAIASIIAMQPKVLVLDEPTAGLDPKGRDTVLSLIKNYQQKTGSTVIIVSHSMEDVAKLADKVLVMNNGKVQMFGTVAEVYSNVDELKEIGLSVPEITTVFSKLKKKGIDCRTDIYTVKDGVEEIKRLMNRGKLND